MFSSRTSAGGTGATLLVLIAFQPGGIAVMGPILIGAAVLLVLATLAPKLPVLHRLPRVGAPLIEPQITIPANTGGELVVNGSSQEVVLRVGFVNKGPTTLRDVTMNVCVARPLDLQACDFHGVPIAQGSEMPDTVIDGHFWAFWADDLKVPVGSTYRSYKVSCPALGRFPIRVTFSADDLYGPERTINTDLIVQAAPDPPPQEFR